MSQSDELKARIEKKKAELKVQYEKLKNDTSEGASEKLDAVKAKLDELSDYLADGWDNMTDAVSSKLNEWLGNDDEKS